MAILHTELKEKQYFLYINRLEPYKK
jgi:hypothetical protein